MSNFPTWARIEVCGNEDKLRIALEIAWEALDRCVKDGTFYERWDLDGTTEEIMNSTALRAFNVMRRIEELGK